MKNHLFLRGLAAILCLQLALPNSALALRPQPHRSGLEEELSAGFEEVADEFELSVQLHLLPVSHYVRSRNKIEEEFPGTQFTLYGWEDEDGEWVKLEQHDLSDLFSKADRISEGKRLKLVGETSNTQLSREDMFFFLNLLRGILRSREEVSPDREVLDYGKRLTRQLTDRFHEIHLGAVPAGLEENPPQGSRFNRRTLLKAAGAAAAVAGLGTWWLTRDSEERFLKPEEVPAPWKQFFKPAEGAEPLPFLGEDYFRFQISSRHLDAGYRAFDPDGKELGRIDATRGDYQRIADPRTGETLGYYRMPVQWQPNFGIERFVLRNPTGGEMMTVSVYPYGQEEEAAEGVPWGWRDPKSLKTETPRPIYQVFEDEKHQVTHVEMIGYVETHADKPGRLLDLDKRPIARLEPVQIIYSGQDPQTFQLLDTALAARPGNNRYFTEAPSEKQAAELSDALDRFQPDTLDGRKAKLQMAHRWIQLQVLLGKRTVAVDPKKARETGEALVKRSTTDLEDFENPEVRRLLWDAIANFHPWFAMAREAVRHLGWEEDPKILRYVLSQIQQWWIELENSKRNALADGDGRMTDLTKDLLEEVLLYNGFQTLDEVADGFKTFLGGSARLSREFLYIDRPKGSDPALVPLSLMQARLRGFRDVSNVQILLHQAVALQRLGYEVSFLSYVPVANGLEKEEPVKTLSHEWLVMATHPDHPKEAVLFSAHREFLKRFGEETSPGVTRVTRERILEVNQTLPPGFYLPMEKYSPFPLDASTYLRARDQAMQRRTKSFPPWHAELMGSGLGLAVESEGELHQQFEQDLASAYVQAMAQRFDEIVKETGIEVVTNGLTGSELEVRKAGWGAALGLIPRKLIKGLKKIVFLRETEIVPFREARVENGRVVWENVDLEAEGTYSNQVIKSVKGVATPAHEIFHLWDLYVTDQIHDWRGDLSELFHQISWQRNGQGPWVLRKTTDVDMRDFAQRTHGLANEREDIAVNGERYVMDSVAFRSEAREAMAGGNYAPAVKYLFAKYLLFLDTDGTSFEYSVSDHSPSITWSEVAAAIRTDAEGLNPKPEAKRLGALVERMREVWLKERESNSIVQRAPEAPLIAAAGLEEGNPEIILPEARARAIVEAARRVADYIDREGFTAIVLSGRSAPIARELIGSILSERPNKPMPVWYWFGPEDREVLHSDKEENGTALARLLLEKKPEGNRGSPLGNLRSDKILFLDDVASTGVKLGQMRGNFSDAGFQDIRFAYIGAYSPEALENPATVPHRLLARLTSPHLQNLRNRLAADRRSNLGDSSVFFGTTETDVVAALHLVSIDFKSAPKRGEARVRQLSRLVTGAATGEVRFSADFPEDAGVRSRITEFLQSSGISPSDYELSLTTDAAQAGQLRLSDAPSQPVRIILPSDTLVSPELAMLALARLLEEAMGPDLLEQKNVAPGSVVPLTAAQTAFVRYWAQVPAEVRASFIEGFLTSLRERVQRIANAQLYELLREASSGDDSGGPIAQLWGGRKVLNDILVRTLHERGSLDVLPTATQFLNVEPLLRELGGPSSRPLSTIQQVRQAGLAQLRIPSWPVAENLLTQGRFINALLAAGESPQRFDMAEIDGLTRVLLGRATSRPVSILGESIPVVRFEQYDVFSPSVWLRAGDFSISGVNLYGPVIQAEASVQEQIVLAVLTQRAQDSGTPAFLKARGGLEGVRKLFSDAGGNAEAFETLIASMTLGSMESAIRTGAAHHRMLSFGIGMQRELRHLLQGTGQPLPVGFSEFHQWLGDYAPEQGTYARLRGMASTQPDLVYRILLVRWAHLYTEHWRQDLVYGSAKDLINRRIPEWLLEGTPEQLSGKLDLLLSAEPYEKLETILSGVFYELLEIEAQTDDPFEIPPEMAERFARELVFAGIEVEQFFEKIISAGLEENEDNVFRVTELFEGRPVAGRDMIVLLAGYFTEQANQLRQDFEIRLTGPKGIAETRFSYEAFSAAAYSYSAQFGQEMRRVLKKIGVRPDDSQIWLVERLGEGQPFHLEFTIGGRPRTPKAWQFRAIPQFISTYPLLRAVLQAQPFLRKMTARGSQVLVFPDAPPETGTKLRVFVRARDAASQEDWEQAVRIRLGAEQLPFGVSVDVLPYPDSGQLAQDGPNLVIKQIGAVLAAEPKPAAAVLELESLEGVLSLSPPALLSLAVNEALKGREVGLLLGVWTFEDENGRILHALFV